MAVANNADDYTNGRVGHFFTANDQTPDDGNLTGQCVTLVKWFLAQMTSVPSPFAARGDARYVGKNLVAQGHAVEVPYSDRRRGDVITMEYGTYGHIYIQLSGGRVFEENVNWPGVASKIVDGDRVYASRIGSEAESWRHDVHVYRIKSYNEQGEVNMQPATPQDVNNLLGLCWGVQTTPGEPGYNAQDRANDHKNLDGKPFYEVYNIIYQDPRTFEYADKCYKAIHGGGSSDQYVPYTLPNLFVKKG